MEKKATEEEKEDTILLSVEVIQNALDS